MSLGGKQGLCKAKSRRKASYRTAAVSTLVPHQIPATSDSHSYGDGQNADCPYGSEWTVSATETDKTPVQADGTAKEEWYQGESRSLENLLHLRLKTLLRDMADSESIEKVAQAVGQDGSA